MKLPKIGAVVVNYNNPGDTRETLDSLNQFLASDKYQLVVYLVNNGCTDLESNDLVLEYPSLIQIISPTNLGFAGGNNLGIKKALGDKCSHILLLNNDATILSQNFFEVLLRTPYDITSPLVEYRQGGKMTHDYGGKVDYLFGRNTHLLSPGKADYYSGACLFIKSEVFQKTKGLDDSFFLYYEDVDFCLSCKKAGFSLGLEQKVKVFHHLSASTNKLGSKKIKILARSHLLFCTRHLPFLSLPFYLAFNLYLNSKRIPSYILWRLDELYKTAYPLLNRLFCFYHQVQEIHIIGDSHVWPYYLKHPFIVHHLGGITAYNLGKKNSTTNSYYKLQKELSAISKKNTLIVFVAGEIDCRLHIYNEYCKKNKRIPIPTLVSQTISNYLKVVEEVVEKGFFVALLSITPAGTEKNLYKKKFFADFATRVKIFKLFNLKLKIESSKRKLLYLDLYSYIVSPDGGINPEFKLDEVHLNNKIVPLTVKLLKKKKLFLKNNVSNK